MSENKNSSSSEMNDKPFQEMINGLSIPPSKLSKEEAWAKLLSAIEVKAEEPKRIALKPVITWAAAAAFAALLLLGGYLLLSQKITIESPLASTLSISLPDGSSVTLNRSSKLSYNRFFGLFARNVFMEGEIFFQVAKHRGTFRVFDVHNHQVEVTGTEFNVISHSDYFTVQCYEGNVKVQLTPLESYKIGRGDVISFKSGRVTRESIKPDIQSRPPWVTGEFTFNNDGLSVVFDELSRYYGIQFNAEGFDPNTRTFSGTLPTGSIETAASILSASLGLTFTFAPDSTSVTFR